MAAAITVNDVVKTFGSTHALDRLTFSVERGEVHGFLGPNGAGKTTTLRVLLGRLRGGLNEKRPRRAPGALRPRPDQEGTLLLQGQPAEGRADRGLAALRRRDITSS